MSDEDALLAAICADPADDTARLAFADLLDEHGGAVEAAWAQFIRAHIRLGTGTEQAGDVPTVLELGSDEWVGRFAARLGFPSDEVTITEWDRGFPESLSGAYPALRACWDELLTRAPFRQLRVLSVTDEAIEDLTLWPRLEQLAALDLTTWDGTTPGDDWTPVTRSAVTGHAVATLATCPALARLDSLALDGFPLTDWTADLLLTSRHLCQLRRLQFYAPGLWAAEYDRVRARLEARFGTGVCGRW